MYCIEFRARRASSKKKLKRTLLPCPAVRAGSQDRECSLFRPSTARKLRAVGPQHTKHGPETGGSGAPGSALAGQRGHRDSQPECAAAPGSGVPGQINDLRIYYYGSIPNTIIFIAGLPELTCSRSLRPLAGAQQIEQVLVTAGHVCLYGFDVDNKQWASPLE